MVSYFYKNIYKETTSFIACTWIGGIDLANPSITLSTPVCRLIVTNAQDFYEGTVTYKDLDDFKHGQISLDILNKLIKVALEGGEEYDGDRIDWKIVFNKNTCQMTLLGYLKNSLPIQVGTFQLDRVSDSEKKQIWTEWMEITTSQFKSLKETQNALALRNHDLEQDYNKMKTVADDLVLQKTATDMALMGKFKELLNEKKRKIRQLELKCKRKETREGSMEENTPSSSLASQPPPSLSATTATTATTATKRRRKLTTMEKQVLSPSNSVKRERTTSGEPHSMNDKASPVVISPLTPPTSTRSKPIQQQSQPPQDLNNDDDMDSGDIGKDPLLTTTRSRYRKLPNIETQLKSKPDSGSDTTDDEVTSD